MRDPYAVLGVKKGASAADIRKAYKSLARKYHPDVAKDDKDVERFKDINAAYDVLGDEDKRALFDQFGEVSTKPGFDAERAKAWSSMGGGRSGPGGFGGTPGGGFRWSADSPDFSGGFGGGAGGRGSPDDILGSIFGGARRRGPRPGQDIEANVSVTLMDVAKGESIELALRRPVVSEIGGQATLVLSDEKLKVRLPPGVEDGQTIRLRGKGGESPTGGKPGDLLITIAVRPSSGLRRDGDALELDVPITFAEALVGAQITVPTFDGDVKVTVPAGVQHGRKLRVPGKGMRLKEGRGDLLLVLRPVAPPAPGDEAQALAAQLEALYEDDVRSELTL